MEITSCPIFTRKHVQKSLPVALDIADEDALEDILGEITEKAGADLNAMLNERTALTEAQGDELLANVEAWASLASEITYTAYAYPPREVGAAKLTLPGWAQGVGKKLTDLSKLLRYYLEIAVKAVKAASFSITLTFPWGV